MQLHLVDAVVKGTLLALFLAISVGPTLFAIIRYSLNHSYKAGIAFVLGVSLSDIMYVAVANFAASWLEALKSYQQPVAFGGAVVLIIVGITGIQAPPPVFHPPDYQHIALLPDLEQRLPD
jgi:threonine/homoserine/homoserine lactone efflux protein